MSYTELHTGRVKHIFNSKNVEKDCERLCKINNIMEIPSYYDDWLETIKSDLSDKYVVIGNSFFEILNHKEEEASDYVSSMSKVSDGEFDFVMMFYNGGTCFSEMIEEALEKNLTK